MNIKKNDKERAIEELEENKLENVFNIISNLSDKVLDFSEENYNITEIIGDIFEEKRKYKSERTMCLLFLSAIQSRMKQQFSIREVPLALTSEKVISSIGVNISYDPNEGLLKESNIRAMLGRYEQEDKTNIEFNNYFIKKTNELIKAIIEINGTECNIHILDCSILDVNLDNPNYEGSTTTYKGGKN